MESKAKYYSLPDDGASIRCNDCKENKNHKDVKFYHLPNGKRLVICESCIDTDWHNEFAEFAGEFRI